jgi:hypothetical protein
MKLKLILFFFISISICGCQKKSAEGKNTIESKDYYMFYKSNLELDESGKNGSTFFLYTKKTNSKDDFVENLNLIVQNLDGMNIDLDKFVSISDNQIKTNGNLIESKRILCKNIEYQRYVFEGKMNNFDLKFLQFDFVKNNKAYVLTYTAKKEDFETYLPQMEESMNSFTLN